MAARRPRGGAQRRRASRRRSWLAATDPLLRDGELPELLVLEALAQTAACHNAGDAGGASRPARGGDAAWPSTGGRAPATWCALRAEKTATMGALVRFTVEARVGERVIARGEMTFAVTAL